MIGIYLMAGSLGKIDYYCLSYRMSIASAKWCFTRVLYSAISWHCWYWFIFNRTVVKSNQCGGRLFRAYPACFIDDILWLEAMAWFTITPGVLPLSSLSGNRCACVSVSENSDDLLFYTYFYFAIYCRAFTIYDKAAWWNRRVGDTVLLSSPLAHCRN